jgi:ATP-binding cassette, subfamily B, bacterial IrtB/YbtQ
VTRARTGRGYLPGLDRGPLRAVWQVFGDRRGPVLRAVLLRVLASVSMGVPVAVVAWCVESIRAGTMTGDRALAASLVVVGAVVGQYGFWLGSNYFAWVATFLAVGEGRVAALRHVQSLPVGTVADQGTGEVSAVLGADYEQVLVFAHHGLMNLVGGAALPLATITGLAVVDVRLAAVVAVSVVAAVPVFRRVNRSFVGQARSRADALAEANARIVEYVQGIATTRSYHQVGAHLPWYLDAVARMREVNDRLAVRITPLAYLSIGTVFLGVPLVIAVCGYGLTGGQVDAATAVVFLVIVLRVYAPLVSVAIETEGLRLTDAALIRIARLRDLPPQEHPARPLAVPENYDVSFEAVTFGYQPGRPVLREVNFVARTGTTTALVGPSGAGKSTLLSLACRFYDPEAGVARLGGVSLADLTADQLFDAVTVVFQDVYLFAGTIRDNIAFGRPDATDAAVETAARAARCHSFVSAMPQGYLSRIGEGGMTLSGGERQRLSIARAILKDAPVVLLDEATSALDPLTERAVQEALTELARGRTVIVAAHRLSTICGADQILVVQAGQIVQRGDHHELIADGEGLYARQWAERHRAARWRLGNRPDAP